MDLWGVIGTVIATASLGWNVWTQWLAGPRITVLWEPSWSGPGGRLAAHEIEPREDAGVHYLKQGYSPALAVTVKNRGGQRVLINHVAVTGTHQLAIPVPCPPMPRVIEAHSEAVWEPDSTSEIVALIGRVSGLDASRRYVWAEVRPSTGRLRRSRKLAV
jgi:hypothetical protein